jgi:hypothetical protein
MSKIFLAASFLAVAMFAATLGLSRFC